MDRIQRELTLTLTLTLIEGVVVDRMQRELDFTYKQKSNIESRYSKATS